MPILSGDLFLFRNIVRIGLVYGRTIALDTIGHVLDPNVDIYDNLNREAIDRGGKSTSNNREIKYTRTLKPST